MRTCHVLHSIPDAGTHFTSDGVGRRCDNAHSQLFGVWLVETERQGDRSQSGKGSGNAETVLSCGLDKCGPRSELILEQSSVEGPREKPRGCQGQVHPGSGMRGRGGRAAFRAVRSVIALWPKHRMWRKCMGMARGEAMGGRGVQEGGIWPLAQFPIPRLLNPLES